MSEKKDRVLRGIAPYAEQQKELLDLIEVNGGELTSDKFDEVYITSGKPEIRCWPYAKDAFILGGMCPTTWSKMLELLQLMAAAAIVEIVSRGKKVSYRKAVAPQATR